MKIDIVHRQETTNSEIANRITSKIRLALGRFTPAIQVVSIAFAEVKGKKTVRGVQCVVKITLRAAEQIRVEGQAGDILSALDICLPRASRTVARSLERQREVSSGKMRNAPLKENQE